MYISTGDNTTTTTQQHHGLPYLDDRRDGPRVSGSHPLLSPANKWFESGMQKQRDCRYGITVLWHYR